MTGTHFSKPRAGFCFKSIIIKHNEILNNNNTLASGMIVVIENRLKQLGDCWLTWNIFYVNGFQAVTKFNFNSIAKPF